MTLAQWQVIQNALRHSQEVFKNFYTEPSPLITQAEKIVRMEVIREQMKSFTNSLGPR